MENYWEVPINSTYIPTRSIFQIPKRPSRHSKQPASRASPCVSTVSAGLLYHYVQNQCSEITCPPPFWSCPTVDVAFWRLLGPDPHHFLRSLDRPNCLARRGL